MFDLLSSIRTQRIQINHMNGKREEVERRRGKYIKDREHERERERER